MTHSDWNEAIEMAAAQIDCGGKGRCPERRMKDDSCLREVTGGDCPHEQAEEIRALQRPAEPRQEGMVMVPVEPTDEMIDRACTYWKLYPAFEGQKPQPTAGEIARFIYTSMLAARPTQEDKTT